MSNQYRTPESACVEYAIAAAEERRFDRIMRTTFCGVVDAAMTDYGKLAQAGKEPEMPSDETCMTKHWTPDEKCVGDGEVVQVPALAYEEMCEPCKTRLQAFEDRREARKRLGAA